MHPIARILIVATSCTAVGLSWAQSQLDGNWRAIFATEGAEGREATVELKGGIGTWTTYARSDKDRKDACVGRPLPLSITGEPAARLDLKLEASSAIAGCRDRKATLQRIDDKTLEGTFDNGRAIKLVRQ